MGSPIKRQVRVGIVGAGLIGRTHSLMLRLLADAVPESVAVTRVYDIDAAAADALASQWPEARSCAGAEQIFDDGSVDAVFVCTPTATHRELCLGAAASGKHVFCEKPLAMNSAEADEIRAAIERAGLVGQVGLVLRFSPVYTVIAAMAAQEGAGRMLAVTMRDDQDFPVRGAHASKWRNQPGLTAGGTLIEHSVHDFDAFAWMFGPIRRLYCRTRVLNGAPGIEDCAVTEFDFEEGFHGQLTSVWHRILNRPSNRRIEVFTENLFLACDTDGAGPIVIQRGEGYEEKITEEEVMRRYQDLVLRERPCLSPLRHAFRIPYAVQDATFVAALRGECAPGPGIDTGVAAQRSVEAAYRSAASGVAVDLINLK
jgi:predicted dehydrogenase